MPQLTYNTIPLCHDFNGEAGSFLRKYQHLDDTILNGEFLYKSAWQGNPMDDTNIGLPLVNWPKPPPLRLNQLYWPCTGASRWAEGVFLCNGQSKNAIVASVGAGVAQLQYDTHYGAQEDTLLGNSVRTLQWSMYLLSYRRVGGCRDKSDYDPDNLLTVGSADDYDLYLLHLVDERYWWQFVDAPDICQYLTSWMALINYLTGQLGLGNLPWALPDTGVQTGYDTGPHQSEWMRASYNTAQLLDAALSSIGSRLVAGTDAGFELSRHTGAENTFNNNIAYNLFGEQLAGTECTKAQTYAMPRYVNVAFPKSRFGMPCGQCDKGDDLTEDDCHEAYHVINHSISEYITDTPPYIVELTSKTIHVRGYADMGACEDATPMNNTELTTLANQIASDWFGYHKRQYDFTMVGPTAWDACGYDDCIIHKFGIEEDDDMRAYAHSESKQTGEVDTTVILTQERRRDCTSRIQSLPLNVGVDCQLHNTNALELPGHLLALTPSGGIAAVNCGTYTGVLCDAYRLTGDLACGTLSREAITAIDSDHYGDQYKVMVYNPSTQDVEEERYVFTAPMQCCARMAVVEPCEAEDCGS
jgi:hypothetical protein